MAMSVVYGNFAGEIVHENRNGEERWYVPDTLGSTQALVDETGAVTDTYDYWSYGEEREHVGTSEADLTFVGTLGYVRDILNRLYYVRARHLRPELARWQTVDPLWPSEMAYVYADDKPAYIVDPTGLRCVKNGRLSADDRAKCSQYCFKLKQPVKECWCGKIIQGLFTWTWELKVTCGCKVKIVTAKDLCKLACALLPNPPWDDASCDVFCSIFPS